MKRLLLLVLLVCAVTPRFAAAQGNEAINYASLINGAGSQRMLTERIAKAYVQIHLGILTERAREFQGISVKRFESNLANLKRAAIGNVEMRNAINVMEAQWFRFNAIVSKPSDKAGLARIGKETDELVQLADNVVATILKASGAAPAKIVNLAGRQRMLSQRLARQYLLVQAGVAPAATRQDIEKTRNEFRAALAELNTSPLSSTAIKQDLKLAQTNWLFFEKALESGGNADALRNVAATSERLLEVMESLTDLYEKSLKSLV